MLQRMFTSLIKYGVLTVDMPGGKSFTAGDPAADPNAPHVRLRVRSRRAAMRVGLDPEVNFGEAYMNGDLDIIEGDLADMMEIYGRNAELARRFNPGLWKRLSGWMGRQIQQRNVRASSQRNVAHHYDLSATLYRQFLDADMHYSCAYFSRPGMGLDEAQQAKVRHLAAKLDLKPGQRVLDIGSGWGGLAMGLAEIAGVSVLGVTLSKEQLAVARERARERGLEDRVSFELMDYRDVEGPFDRIVSVGMFEHVGAPNFEAYFSKVRDLLTEDGIAVIHSIGSVRPPSTTNRWMRKYIFPGGYAPALSETMATVERSGLWSTDIEILRLHYAETCRQWRVRFHQNATLVRQIYDERFFRMWDFYLAASEMGFRHGGLMVFQLQLAKGPGVVPITRDYMFEAERATTALKPAYA